MRILIVGGGIGGLTLCAFLRKNGLEPVLIEREQEWKTIGYVLGLFPNGYNVLADIGAAASVRAEAVELTSFTIKDGEGKAIRTTDFRALIEEIGPILEVERDHVHQVLREINESADIRMGTTLRALEQDAGSVYATFEDGKEEVFDLVVGADGINSQVRKIIFPEAAKQYSGFTLWGTWIQGIQDLPRNPVNYFGDRAMVGIFPDKDPSRAGVLFMLPAPPKAFDRTKCREHLQRYFSSMGGEVPAVLQALPPSDEIYHNDDDEILLSQWHAGRIGLLGDSVHALSPILGMGASMAMEDASVLSQELMRADTIEKALERYGRRRLPRVQFLSQWSKSVHQVLAVGSTLYKPRNLFVREVFSRRYYTQMMKLLRQQP